MSPGNGLILRSNFERLGLAVFLIAIVVVLSFCRGGADKGPVRTLEAGVEIVENGAGIYPDRGEPRTLSLREEFRIDLEDESLAQAGLTEVRFLDVDSLGRLYLYQSPVDRGKVILHHHHGLHA